MTSSAKSSVCQKHVGMPPAVHSYYTGRCIKYACATLSSNESHYGHCAQHMCAITMHMPARPMAFRLESSGLMPLACRACHGQVTHSTDAIGQSPGLQKRCLLCCIKTSELLQGPLCVEGNTIVPMLCLIEHAQAEVKACAHRLAAARQSPPTALEERTSSSATRRSASRQENTSGGLILRMLSQ